MNQSIIQALAAVSDALAAVTEPDQLAPVAAQAIVKVLSCQTAAVWLLAEESGLEWPAHLEQVPGIGQAVRRLRKNGSRAVDTQLHLVSTSNGRRRLWQRPFDKLTTLLRMGRRAERATLAALTDGQVTAPAELPTMSSRALRVGGSDSAQDLSLVAGLFRTNEPVGVLVCTWTGTDTATSSDSREVLVASLANYLGQVLGDQSTLSPETGVYLAGAGLLLTALDVGSSDAKDCAEVVTRSALQMAADKNLHPAEAQSLQWAALFHEVGRVPMSHWLTFPTPDGSGESAESEPDDPLSLTLIPDLQSAADLLIQVAPVLGGQDGDLGSDISRPAKLLAEAYLSSHCRQAQPPSDSATGGSDGQSLQTEETWDEISPHIEASISQGLSTPVPQTI
ncbi:MAG: hypothetical protein ACE5F6_04485 [Anaerolineae bacterium]